jgi:hypothetical protein
MNVSPLLTLSTTVFYTFIGEKYLQRLQVLVVVHDVQLEDIVEELIFETGTKIKSKCKTLQSWLTNISGETIWWK